MNFKEKHHGRIPDWPAALDAFVETRRHWPFSWGVNDCCLFAADWVQIAYGGVDPAARYRGTYSTAVGALRHVQKAGGVAGLPVACGLEPTLPALAGRGDVVGIVSILGLTLGVCLGAKVVAPGRAGLIFVSRSAVRHAWKV